MDYTLHAILSFALVKAHIKEFAENILDGAFWS